jgi:hypothetical protein
VQEGTRLQYKYTRGNWETVEQWGAISGMNNRQLQIVAGPDNTMLVDDTATDWGAGGSDDHRAVETWRDPLVAATEPAANSSGPVDAVRAEFAVLVSSTAPNQVLTVTDAVGDAVSGTVAQEGGRTFIFTPDQPLVPGDYTATVFNVATDTPMINTRAWLAPPSLPNQNIGGASLARCPRLHPHLHQMTVAPAEKLAHNSPHAIHVCPCRTGRCGPTCRRRRTLPKSAAAARVLHAQYLASAACSSNASPSA